MSGFCIRDGNWAVHHRIALIAVIPRLLGIGSSFLVLFTYVQRQLKIKLEGSVS
jgi:hypothetical protein